MSTPWENGISIEKIFDVTLLDPLASADVLKTFFESAKKIRPKCVCVHPANVSMAKAALDEPETGIASVVGFPMGANLPKVKFFEARCAVEDGATEIDMVMNLGLLKSGNYNSLAKEVEMVVSAVHGAPLKLIIEAPVLSDEEKITACKIAADAGAAFIKTCSGITSNWADPKDIALIRDHIPAGMKIKASGKVNSLERVRELYAAGASRFGLTLQQALDIVKESEI